MKYSEKEETQVQVVEYLEEEKTDQHVPSKFDATIGDPLPEDPILKARETRQCTFRSIAVGSFFGLIIGMANIYLGLKIGWGMGAGIFAVFAGFASLKGMEKYFPPGFGGGYFGPKENVSCQSAANGACAAYGPFVAAVPAMYALGLLSTPQQDFGKLVGLGIVCGFYGMFFAIPLRKFFILRQRLVFPDAVATAIAIRTLHTSMAVARQQVRCLLFSFLASLIWAVVKGYAPGILGEWSFFYWMSLFGGSRFLAPHNWGWGIVETNACFFGVGMIVGWNGSLSFYGGCVLAWGFLGPLSIALGWTKGIEVSPGQWIYFSNKYGHPRYWLLWPGVFVMLCASLTELLVQYKVLWGGIKAGLKDLMDTIRRRPLSISSGEDPMGPADQVPIWAWLSGLIASIVLSCVLLKVQFDVPVGHSILGVVLAFLFSFVGVHGTGTLAINPVGPIAKCSQLIFGGISKAQGQSVKAAQMSNLIAGSLAGQAASHSADMVVDLKIGHLMSATPKGQFWAQLWGTVSTIVPMVGAFLVYTKAYPCIINHDESVKCPFELPAVMAWKAVAMAMTETDNPIPRSSELTEGITAIVLGVLAISTSIFKSRLRPTYRGYVLNWVAVGIAFTAPLVRYAFPMVCGALFASLLKRYRPALWGKFGYPLAAGLTAGEACSGLVTAGLVIGGIGGYEKGTMIGCPFGEC